MGGAEFLHLKPVERSMLDEVHDIFLRHQAGSARSLQRHLGPSEAGHPCDRQIAYKMAGITPAVPEHLKWAALVGTWGHAGAEQAMREENARLGRERYLAEQRSAIDDENLPGGNTDIYDTDYDEVLDWKFVGESSLAKYRRSGAPRLYIVQAMLYALGWKRSGRSPKSVRIMFLTRASNDFRASFEWAVEYDEQIALDALDRLATIRAAVNLVQGGLVPWSNLPADKSDCRFCPYLRRKTIGEPDADETGCLGHLNPSADLEGLAGGDPVARGYSAAEHLAQLISNAQHPDALTALWRNAHEPAGCRCRQGEPCGRWLPEHSKAAGERRAALA